MDLFYEVKGTGAPIVMVHSPGTDSREWQQITPILAEQYQVITFDMRGMGRSPSPQCPTDIVKDLKDLLDHLNLKQVSLVGHSMGGQVATAFALAYPSIVDRLILIAPSLSGFVYSQSFMDYMAQINAAAPDIPKMIELSTGGPNYRIIMESEHKDLFLEMHTQYMTKMLTEWKSFDVIWPQVPAIERLDELAPAALFVQGTVEWPEMKDIAEHFERVPFIQFSEFADADHMLTLTHGKRLAQLILNFLKERRNGAGEAQPDIDTGLSKYGKL